MKDQLKEFAQAQRQQKAVFEAEIYRIINQFESETGLTCADIALKRLEQIGHQDRLMSVNVTAEIR